MAGFEGLDWHFFSILKLNKVVCLARLFWPKEMPSVKQPRLKNIGREDWSKVILCVSGIAKNRNQLSSLTCSPHCLFCLETTLLKRISLLIYLSSGICAKRRKNTRDKLPSIFRWKKMCIFGVAKSRVHARCFNNQSFSVFLFLQPLRNYRAGVR